MRIRIKISQDDYDQLTHLLFRDLPQESAAFALAGVARRGGYTDILVRRIVSIPREHYEIKENYHLRISPIAINGLAALCEANGLGAVLCHSHPTDVDYSPSDDDGEQRIFATLRSFMPASAPTASILLTPARTKGRVWEAGSAAPRSVSDVVVLGRTIQHHSAEAATEGLSTKPIYARQVEAFGEAGQLLINQTKVGIVGVGGTGSPTGEQLTRLGVEDLVLVDPDEFEPSNITRVYGTFASSARKRWWKRVVASKVELVASHLRAINPEASVKAFAENIVIDAAAEKLLDRDIIFLCTDDHWGRAIVNQIVHQYFIPAINIGARIAAEDSHITAAPGVVDVLRPDKPCLWCSEFLRAERISAESMPPKDRERLQKEGYVEGLDITGPSVVSMTTALSGMAVSVFLQLLTDFMGGDGDVVRLNYNLLDGRVRRGETSRKARCQCRQSRAFGDLKRLPTLSNLDYLKG